MATEAFVTFVHVHVIAGAEDAFLEASRMNDTIRSFTPPATGAARAD